MLATLKIKLMSLGAEARIIKNQEAKFLRRARSGERKEVPEKYREDAASRARKAREAFSSLRHHRIHAVRPECRHSHLAYGFLRNVPYKRIEQKCYELPDWDRVQSMVERFGSSNGQDVRDLRQKFAAWKEVQ